MKRLIYNRNVLKECLENLKSTDILEVCDGAVQAAYLIEQALKSHLRKINPLLYYDRRNLKEEDEVGIVLGSLTEEQARKLKTAGGRQCILYICAAKNEFAEHKSNLIELFELRNEVLHSIEDFNKDLGTIAESATSALKACKNLISDFLEFDSEKINPLTSKEFSKLLLQRYKLRMQQLTEQVERHRQDYLKKNNKQVLTKADLESEMSWIEDVYECPACANNSFSKVCEVDFDWNPDGIITSSGCSYICTECGLSLSEYEFGLVTGSNFYT